MATIIECFTGFIGILGCNSATPGSGLYINSLPGVTLEMVDKIADAEQVTYVGVWQEVEQRAILRFRTQFMAKLNECYQINQRATVECIACENKDLLATSLWYLLGSELMVERIYSNRINRYTTIDEDEAKELRDHFTVEFEKELSLAVQGINVEESDCVTNETDCLQQNGPIHWRESAM
jgi:hypothetical protein